MATTSIYFPLVGESSKIDIVWIYPTFLFGGEGDSHAPPPSAPPEEKASSITERIAAPAEKPAVQERPARETAAANRTEQPSPPLSSPPVREKAAEPVRPAPEPLTSEQEAESDTEPEMSIPQEKPLPPPKKVTSEPQGKVVARETPPPVEKGQPAKIEHEKKSGPPVIEAATAKARIESPAPTPVSKAPATLEQPPISRKPPLQNERPQPPAQQTTAKIATPSLHSPPETLPREATPPRVVSQTSPLQGISGGERTITVEKRREPTPDTKTVTRNKTAEMPQKKSTGPKGIFFAPPLSGDLKIEITGSDEALKAIKIKVIFREYARARHNRPMTKANFRNFRELSPKMARVAKNILQAVIETAGEGIYEFRNISDSAAPAEAAFTIKIYENSARAKTKPVGSRMVNAKGSITKVLMPEGVLWDDDSAFSGSLEDSESVTRFNTDSGLVWKEYKE